MNSSCFRGLAWLSVSLSGAKVGGVQTPDGDLVTRRSQPLTRRLSVDSLISEDDYVHQRLDRNQLLRGSRQIIERKVEDYYQEYDPSQFQLEPLEYDQEFEPYNSYDKYLPPRRPRDQHQYRDQFTTYTIPRRRYQQAPELTEDWRKYRGQWRSLYEGLDYPEDYSRGSRQRSYLERDYSRNYSTAASARSSQRSLYEYYDYS